MGKKITKTFCLNGKELEREVEFMSLVKYDTNGRQIYAENCQGYKCTIEYEEKQSENGKIVIEKNSDSNGEVNIYTYFYDKNDRLVQFKDKNDVTLDFEYNSDGKRTKVKNSEGYESIYEYDKNGNEIHKKHSGGKGTWYEIEDGYLCKLEDNDAEEFWTEYDDKNRKIHTKHSGDGGDLETWIEYKDDGKVIFRNQGGSETVSEYSPDGKLIHRTKSNGQETFCSYSKNLEYKKVVFPTETVECFFVYEYYENGKMKSKTYYFAEK